MIPKSLMLSIAVVALAGCAAPDTAGETRTPAATLDDPPSPRGETGAATTSSPKPPPSEPTAITPTALPPPTPPPTVTGFVLRAEPTADGGFAFFDESGEPNPTLLVPPSTTITIDLRREGDLHGLSVGDRVLAGAGSSDVRVSFDSPASGAFEYGCPVHPHLMRGTVRVA